MIRVTVLYPNQPDAKFDETYYVQRHLPFVKQRLSEYGLTRLEVEKGLTGAMPGTPPPFLWIGHMYFDSPEAVQKAFAASAAQLMGDIPNFTNVAVQTQIGEVVMAD